MSGVYDNWNRLVEAVLKREQLRQLAYCESLSSSSSHDFSSRCSVDSSLEDAAAIAEAITTAVGNSSTEAIAAANITAVGNSSTGAIAEGVTTTVGSSYIVAIVARLFTAPAAAFARYRRRKRQVEAQMDVGNTVFHRNLIRLHGFCMTPKERLLVYPLMVNGSVGTWLRGRPESQPPLDWPIRKWIALGSARGLAYLHDHCDPKIVHRDVKASNILLDEDFEVVLGDFGVAKLMDHKDTHVATAELMDYKDTHVATTELKDYEDTYVNTCIHGTMGHIALEYLSTGKCSVKTDVFGYGVMLLELISGQRAFDLSQLANDDDAMLLDWVKGVLKEKRLEALVDADLQGNYIDEEVEQLIQVALLCTQGSPMEQPKMSEVVRMLEGDGLAERWEKWQKEEMFRQDFPHPNTDWIIADSTSNIQPDELSGPR